mgnify:CR=1 FL=1
MPDREKHLRDMENPLREGLITTLHMKAAYNKSRAKKNCPVINRTVPY